MQRQYHPQHHHRARATVSARTIVTAVGCHHSRGGGGGLAPLPARHHRARRRPLDRQCGRGVVTCSSADPSTSTSSSSPPQPPQQQQNQQQQSILLPSYADVAAAAAARGLRLERAVAGPFYRIELYEGEAAARRRAERQAERRLQVELERRRRRRRTEGGGGEEATDEEEDAAAARAAAAAARAPPPPPTPELLATTDGFCVPPPLGAFVHCDTLRIPQRATLGDERDGDDAGAGTGALGLMPLIGCAVLAHARERGCRRAEILAIDDDDDDGGAGEGGQHRRLVSYYRYFGFRPLHRVGGRGFFVDLPHLLVWGGEGLRMDLDVEATLRRWGRVLLAPEGARRPAGEAI